MIPEDSEDSKIANLYEILAKLLPLEGRDYVLNPHVTESGSVAFNPVVYTDIGKVWVDYLARTLPQLAGVPPNDVDRFIESIKPRESKIAETVEEQGCISVW